MKKNTREKISKSLKRHYRLKRLKAKLNILTFIVCLIAVGSIAGNILNAQTVLDYVKPEIKAREEIEIIKLPKINAERYRNVIHEGKPINEVFNALTLKIEASIRQLESNGVDNCHELIHKSGEKGCRGYLPSTFNLYSKQVLGEVVERTPENEKFITLSMIDSWLEQGYSVEAIGRIWNQGNAGECQKGTNKYGVKFNSCTYANKLVELVK